MTQYTSDPRHYTGPECQSMDDVRYEIDRLDRLLVAMVKERQTYMDAAARIKPSRSAVRDEARIEDVVQKVLQCAEKEGLSAQIAEPVWRTMIEQCIAYEFSRWDDLRKA
ncbi:MAG: chorismate mutase [Robiginitomaculum sp.]|nr:MAG: chorismate mutase [Robiginitomaculum sp.]